MKANKLFKTILFLFIIFFEQNAFSQDSTIVLVKLKKTNSAFEVVNGNALDTAIKNSYFQKYLFVDSLLQSVSVYDMDKKLYDGIYNNALTLFEYKKDTLKFIKLYDKNNRRVAEGFMGYWSIEFSYDNKRRIIMETYKDTANNLVKYYPNFDFKPPYIKYKYLAKNKCMRELCDNTKTVQFIDTCDCPKLSYKLKN